MAHCARVAEPNHDVGRDGYAELMTGRRTNVALFSLLLAAFGTGALGFAIGVGWNRWVTITHGIVGLAILALSPWKQVIVGRGIRRPRRGRAVSVVFLALVTVALVTGFAHSTGLLISMGPVTAMQVHVGAALLSIPLVIWHVIARPARVHRTDLSRRALLRSGALLGGAGAAYAAVEAVSRLGSLPGRERRFTGSFARGSFDPERMPVTQWLNDAVPAIDAQDWTLTVSANGESGTWSYDDLLPYSDELTATIDCTGGWFAEQQWEGVWLARLLPGEAAGRSIHIRSATGYGRRYPTRDVGHLLLATRVGGRPLSAGHGFPLRVCAPGRRGFWWVKWVTEITVDDVPWWVQPPFPVT